MNNKDFISELAKQSGMRTADAQQMMDTLNQ